MSGLRSWVLGLRSQVSGLRSRVYRLASHSSYSVRLRLASQRDLVLSSLMVDLRRAGWAAILRQDLGWLGLARVAAIHMWMFLGRVTMTR